MAIKITDPSSTFDLTPGTLKMLVAEDRKTWDTGVFGISDGAKANDTRELRGAAIGTKSRDPEGGINLMQRRWIR